MNDEVGTMALEQSRDAIAIADVQVVVREVPSLAPKPLQVPRRITIGTKERPAHVVVDAVHVPPELIEKRHRLGADEPAAARHDGSFHDPGPPAVATSLRRLGLGNLRRHILSSSPGRTDTTI